MTDYEKRKDYLKQYYQKKRRENKEWVEEQINKCKEYKKKNKNKILKTTRDYRATYKGGKSHKISEWTNKKKRGHTALKETSERLDYIFNLWFNAKKCDLCYVEFKSKKVRCMEHHHPSGHFRNIVCVVCNNKIGKIDRQKNRVMLELHKYFIINEIFF